VRKHYALLQTPDFVEAFILDRTLEPAVETFGLQGFRMIDPTCGSGHFLLGGFERLLAHWQEAEPGTEVRELVKHALGSVYGVDLNPYAVAIARFRLVVAALKACGLNRLADAPDFTLHLTVGDSLYHGRRFARSTGKFSGFEADYEFPHVYGSEVESELREILHQQYHCVVGNPPYITPKDKALNAAYRERYGSCSGVYALSVPFLERFVELAIEGKSGAPAGFTGQITANSFMKREFGSKLIEEYFPNWDLTHVIDTSGAYIPGHGTPTVVLFIRNQHPASDSVRAVLGIRGEPSTPEDPARGQVWTEILESIERPGAEGKFVSVAEVNRAKFGEHPWSLGGGGASELKVLIEERAQSRLGEHVASIGFASFPGTDDAFVAPIGALRRQGIMGSIVKSFVPGDSVRDWVINSSEEALAPYGEDAEALPLASCGDPVNRWIWPLRATLGSTKSFGGVTRAQSGDWLHTWYRWVSERYRTPLSIAFAFVATHNHFVLDRGGKVFKQSAPVIKLPPDATEDDHYALLAVLNSSLACFWMKQVFHNKGDSTDQHGARVSGIDAWVDSYEFASTGLLEAPVYTDPEVGLARMMTDLATRLSDCLSAIEPCAREVAALSRKLVFVQEELDWSVISKVLDLDGVVSSGQSPDGVSAGERAFEIALARSVNRGESSTSWFTRHGVEPVAGIPVEWPVEYRSLVERRIELIESRVQATLVRDRRRFERKRPT
jgi:hypothetical protein